NTCNLELLEKYQENLFCILSSSVLSMRQMINQHAYAALEQVYEILTTYIAANNLYLGIEYYKEIDTAYFVEKVNAVEVNKWFSLVDHNEYLYIEKTETIT